jgi:hypothetical protein
MYIHKVVRYDEEAVSGLAPKQGHDRFDVGINGRGDRLHLERSGRRPE